MPTSTKKWFTCTPIRFAGDHTFFARDSGLLCKGFQEIGIECKAIMPGPPMENDQTADLIRTDYRNLEDPEWWKSLGGEGVVFYGWGAAKYLRIVKAIKSANLVLVTHLDTGGLISVLNGPWCYTTMLWRISLGESDRLLSGLLRFTYLMMRSLTVGLFYSDINRARHFKQADLIGVISPIAHKRIDKVCRIYGGEKLAARLHLIPHPNASYMSLDPAIPKERLVVTVGRWDDAKVKGTVLLMELAERCTALDPALIFEIYGRPSQSMLDWHGNLSSGLRNRIHLVGVVPNTEIMKAYQRARISLCTSLRESYNISLSESLCCGCSVVGPDVPEIPSMKWFASRGFGRMVDRTVDAMSRAVIDEIAIWDDGKRNPAEISNHWSGLLHAPRIAEKIINLVDDHSL